MNTFYWQVHVGLVASAALLNGWRLWWGVSGKTMLLFSPVQSATRKPKDETKSRGRREASIAGERRAIRRHCDGRKQSRRKKTRTMRFEVHNGGENFGN
ncbi:hypothetical protein Zmor_027469 [Zophobas morio]|mgnify:CR=1 FL=1|uniref:Uncharacterized protein n=1 Tax=Zophobas morio TaxID=2755281 RepID=A0AA38HQQ5_9CUCU|nr:hypothetical protein Zmor_027469 [Zophobas morio]